MSNFTKVTLLLLMLPMLLLHKGKYHMILVRFGLAAARSQQSSLLSLPHPVLSTLWISAYI